MLQHPVTEFSIAHTEAAVSLFDSNGSLGLNLRKNILAYDTGSTDDQWTRELKTTRGQVYQDWGITEVFADVKWGGSYDTNAVIQSAAAMCHARGDQNARYLYKIEVAGNLTFAGCGMRVGFGYAFNKPDGSAYPQDRTIIYKWLPLKAFPRNRYSVSDSETDDDVRTCFQNTEIAASFLVADAGGPRTPPATSSIGSTYNAYTYPQCVAAVVAFINSDTAFAQPASALSTGAQKADIHGDFTVQIDRLLRPDPGLIYRKF